MSLVILLVGDILCVGTNTRMIRGGSTIRWTKVLKTKPYKKSQPR